MLLFPHLGRPDGLSDAAKRPDNNAARPQYGNGQALRPGRTSEIETEEPYFAAVGSGFGLSERLFR
jgi:hypothetical protein